MNINNINTDIGNSSLKPVFPSAKRSVAEQSLTPMPPKNFIDTPTHFETDYISMKWIPEKHRIDVIWKQFVSEDKVREVLLKEVAMIRHTKVKCLFLDAQKFKGTNPNIPRWANEVWSQMVHDAGLKHFATVVSDKDIFAVFSLKYGMGEKLMSLVNCAVFKTLEEGEIWLRRYTHPENPVYSNDELEQIMEEYENPIKTIPVKTERKKTAIISPKNKEFDVKNKVIVEKEEVKKDIEQDAKTDKNKLSQIQVFSKFEDLESHIQNIESKYETKSNDSDNSESQS